MRITFTKMQGAGNDFVVLDETAGPLGLTAAQYRWLADRHFGVGADQILGVRRASAPEVDFDYVIHNGGDGGQVEHCGNGARCFLRFVRERGMTAKRTVRVQVQKGVLELTEQADGGVTVDMGVPVFALGRVPFSARGLAPQPAGKWRLWPLVLEPADQDPNQFGPLQSTVVYVAVLSLGNPHAVQLVDNVDRAPVAEQGPLIERHPAFPQRVNAGFMQIVDRGQVRLRVYERGAGETLACGSGACAAVVAGIRLGLLDARVQVRVRGGQLVIEWAGGASDPVRLTGPAQTVFEGSVELPNL